jgi:2'-hydroxyisoflavone reductase
VKLLLLGGPRFLGRAVIDVALERGHAVTLFNRGTTGADLYPEIERIVGDRDGGLDGLCGREWDAVVDTSGYIPRIVGASASLLAGAVGHYVFVSSISVYASFAEVVDEGSPPAEASEPGSEDVSADTVPRGALRAGVDAAFPGRSTAVRAGLIVGPHDPTGRFTYWPHRVRRGGDMVVPGPAWRPVQFVDVRDLAAWMVTAAEEGLAGSFNATGPATMGAVIDAARRVSGSSARAVEVDDAFLTGQGVGEWMELPLWIDPSNDDRRHFMEVDASRATGAGLTFRALDETVAATLADAELVDGVGLAPERERGLLDAWWSRGMPAEREPESAG